MKKNILIAILSIFVTSSAVADRVQDPGAAEATYSNPQANDSILNDVYVKLYLARLRKAQLAIEREKQELQMRIKQRDRAEWLYVRNAMSAEELELRRKEVEVAAIRVQEAEAAAQEAETFVDIAVSRISIGLEMPICAELR